MGCLFDGKLFLGAKATPVRLDDPRAMLSRQSYGDIVAAGIDDQHLVAEGERRQAGRQLRCGILGDENSGKFDWIHQFLAADAEMGRNLAHRRRCA